MIAKAIHDLKEPDFDTTQPVLWKSTKADKAVAKDENTVFQSILVNNIGIWNDNKKIVVRPETEQTGARAL